MPGDPNKIPLGDGLADKAKKALRGRKSRIDAMIEAAEGAKKDREKRAKDAGSDVRDSAPRSDYIEDET